MAHEVMRMVSSRKKKMALSCGTLLERALVKTVTPDLGRGEAWGWGSPYGG